MTRRFGGVAWRGTIAAAGTGAIMLGGCGRVSKSQYEMALQENNDLRQRNAELEAELAGLQGQMDGTGGTTGFENIDGVSVSRGLGGEIIVNIEGDILFDSGQVELKPGARRALDRVASTLKTQYAGNLVRVEGYTDTDPIRKSKWKDNEELSAERALAVERYLVSKGVNNDLIYAAAFGPSRTKATKKDSRRVEVVVLGATE